MYLPTATSHCSNTGGCKNHHRKKGILVTAELQVCIALFVVLDVHGFHVGVGQQASLHGSEASVGLCHVNACDGDAVTWLHCPSDLAPKLNVNASGGSSMRHLETTNPLMHCCLRLSPFSIRQQCVYAAVHVLDA